MRRALTVVAVLAPAAALACGGFFAQGVEVSADQKIIVTHRSGVETYTFRPHFCGTAKDFGVILPIPSALTTNPTLAPNALFDQLDTFTAPTIVEVCHSPAGGCGSDLKAGRANDLDGGTSGANVVDRGRVGIFDYVLLQATSAAAFTDWLDANGFPRGNGGADAGVDPYAEYVSKGWYFVAFKVSADTAAPPAGSKLCGDLGPITLSFAASAPVVPARIASVNGGGGIWRLFVVAAAQQTLDAASSAAFYDTVYFSGALAQAELTAAPDLAAASRDGERLTVLDVTMSGAAADLGLVAASASSDHRSQRTVLKDCKGGCAIGEGMPTLVLGTLVALSLLRRLQRRRRVSAH